MSHSQVARRARGRLACEEGAILPFFALLMLTLLLFVSFVVDAGNWFTHNRQLQQRVDAGALASGAYFTKCFFTGQQATANAEILDAAKRWSGDSQWSATPLYNNQFPNAENVHALVNSQAFWSKAGAGDGTGPDGQPCAAGYSDVKGTDQHIPWFISIPETLFGLPKTSVNAVARVQIKKKVVQSGSLPLAVPDPTPYSVSVKFVEASGKNITCVPASCMGVALAAPTVNTAAALASWQMSQVIVKDISADMRIRVRVALGGQAATDPCSAPYVQCFESETSGLSEIRGYSATTGPVRAVWPYGPATGTNCTPGSNSSFFYAPTYQNACTVKVAAVVPGATGEGPYAQLGNGNFVKMIPDGGEYRVTFPPVSAQLGGQDVNICLVKATNNCKKTDLESGVQRVFSGSRIGSGPIRILGLTASECGSDAKCNYSIPSGSTEKRTYTVMVGTRAFQAADPSNPGADEITALRLASDSGNLNQAFDCDGRSLRDQIATGCQQPYQLNKDFPSGGCPRTPPKDPPDCVPIGTAAGAGDKIGQLRQGMEKRFGCAPNNWGSYPNISPDDPRVVQLIVTDFGAFQNNNSKSAAVRRFATFYVTGWDNGGQSCPGNDPYPFSSQSKDWQGDIWGHFIVWVDAFNAGGTTSETCDFSNPLSIDPCVAVLVK